MCVCIQPHRQFYHLHTIYRKYCPFHPKKKKPKNQKRKQNLCFNRSRDHFSGVCIGRRIHIVYIYTYVPQNIENNILLSKAHIELLCWFLICEHNKKKLLHNTTNKPYCLMFRSQVRFVCVGMWVWMLIEICCVRNIYMTFPKIKRESKLISFLIVLNVIVKGCGCGYTRFVCGGKITVTKIVSDFVKVCWFCIHYLCVCMQFYNLDNNQ